METPLMFLLVLCFVSCMHGISCHPSRPPIPEDPMARALFFFASFNNTEKYLAKEDLESAFIQFDNSSDDRIDKTEFFAKWSLMKFGEMYNAQAMFSHLDTDNDGHITRVPDLERIFNFFDVDGDLKITEKEFTTIWFKLSS